MKGPCLTECGLDVDYEPIEFSDGFVYYLPRNLDKTVHNCLMTSADVIGLVAEHIPPKTCSEDNDVPYFKQAYEKFKNNVSLTYDEFCSKVISMQEETPGNFWEGDGPMDMSLVWMLVDGRMFDAKRILERQMKTFPAPFFQSREDPILGNMYGDTQPIQLHMQKYSNSYLADMVHLNLPTNMGYQLEHLGLFYKLRTH